MTHFSSCFHAVGQGLFATGCFYQFPNDSFSFVYDCGSTRRYRAALEQEIQSFSNQAQFRDGTPEIGMVILSHFDEDHINGLALLLARFRVKTLVLPVIPLWQRLILLFEMKRYCSRSTTKFLLNPTESILRQFDGRIGEILLVPPSNGSNDGFKGEARNPNNPPVGERVDGRGDSDARVHITGAVVVSKEYESTTIKEISVGASLHLCPGWEFVPYNDAWAIRRADTEFIAESERLRDILLNQSAMVSWHMRKDAIMYLKRHYFGRYPKGARQNRASLFIYSGATKGQNAASFCRDGPRVDFCETCEAFGAEMLIPANGCCRSATLYCGDGDLSTKKKSDALMQYLGASRFSRLFVLQVAHHGAKTSWYSGLAGSFAAPISIFSAGIGCGHPNSCVREDFAKHGKTVVTGDRHSISSNHWF